MELREKKHLGIHTEMFSDSAMELMQCGAVDNSRKTSERGRTVTSFSMGTKALYDFIDDNPAIVHKALSYTNDPNVIAANRGMASINAALQVDLTGPVCLGEPGYPPDLRAAAVKWIPPWAPRCPPGENP